MAEAELKAVLKVEDRTRAGIDSASGNFDKLKGAALKLGGVIAAAFAVDKIVDFGKASFNAFADAEASAARVSATLATMGKAGLDAADDIDRLSAAALKLGFDDEDAAESVTKLFKATGDLTEATKLHQVAMDLSRAKQIDLSDATRIVTLMLSGNTKELKALGIEVEEGASALDNLAKVQAAVGGQAEAYSKTTQGSLERLSNAYENLQESVGELLASALTPLIEKFANFLAALPPVDQMLKNLWQDIQNLLSVIDENTGLITLMREAWDSVSASFNDNLLPALKELWATLQPYKPFFDALVTVLGTMLVVAIGLVVKVIEGWVLLLIELLSAWAKVQAFLNEKMMPIFSAIGDSIATVVGWVEKLIAALSRLNVMSAIGGAAKSAASAVSGLFGRASGGPVSSATPYMVGENGPEVFVPNTAGAIIPNGALAGGGGITVNINGGIFLDEYGADMIGTKMVERLRSQFRF